MPHTWRSATLRQARSDYEMLRRLLSDNDVDVCQVLHYLQMTTEKLAKAFLTPPGGRYPNTHNAFAEFVRVVKRRREFQAACGFSQAIAFRAYMEVCFLLRKQWKAFLLTAATTPTQSTPGMSAA